MFGELKKSKCWKKEIRCFWHMDWYVSSVFSESFAGSFVFKTAYLDDNYEKKLFLL